MAQEQSPEQGPVPLKAIHIVLEATDGRLTKLTFTPDGSFDVVSQIARFASPQITERSVERLTDDVVAPPQPQPRIWSVGRGSYRLRAPSPAHPDLRSGLAPEGS